MENFITRDAYSYMPRDQAQAMRRSAAIRLAREKRKNALERARIAAQLKVAEMEQKPALMRSRAALEQAVTGARETGLRYGPGGLEEKSLGLTKEELERRFPYGYPKYTAETGRINALAAQRKARATEEWTKGETKRNIAQAKRDIGELGIEQANQVTNPTVAAPSEEAIVSGLSKKLKKKKPLVEEPTGTTTEEPRVLTDWLGRLLGY